MIHAVETYLTMRRAVGFELSNADYLLRSFARFAAERGETWVRAATAIDWASQAASVAQRDERLKTVCRFVRYICVEDNQHELPPSNHFGYRKTRRVPHIYSRVEIRRLMDTALQLKPVDSIKPHTYATLIGLMAATGLRISEAISLLPKHIDSQRMVIRVEQGKGQKDRLWAAAHKRSYVPEKVMRCELRENLGRQAPRSDFPAHNYLPLNEAMSLSAGRKEPRFRVGGRTASSISRFCAGSARRYASVL